MYTILMNKDKTLVASRRIDLYEGDNLVDKIQFLFPQTYKDIDLEECIVRFNYIDLTGEECSEILVKDDELYKNKLRYRYPIDSNFTKLYGDITFDISFSMESEDVLFHTEKHAISIIPHIGSIPPTEIIPEDSAGKILKEVYKIEERVDELEENWISEGAIQSDWQQNDNSENSYIKNRTHYKQVNETFVSKPSLGVTTLYDLTTINSYYYNTYFGYDNVLNDDWKYGCAVTVTAILSSGEERIYRYELYSGLKKYVYKIDDTNYYWLPLTSNTGLKVFFILDVSKLTEEYKAKFTNVGVFLEMTTPPSSVKYTVGSIQFEFIQYNQLSRKYIPSVIARQDYVDEKFSTAVLITDQSLTDKQKEQARINIGAISQSDLNNSMIQSDWNQNDDTKNDFIKNRTHYELSPAIVVTKDKCVFGIPAWDFKIADVSEELIIGKMYRITMTDTGRGYTIPFLDKEYECVETAKGKSIVVKVSDFNISENTGAPYTTANEWVFYSFNGGLYIEDSGYSQGSDQQYNYTILVQALEGRVKQLDEKYIPDTIQRVSDTAKALENVLYVEIDDTIVFSDGGNFVINDDGDGNITITSSKIEVGDINHDVTITSSVLNIIDDERQNITIIEQ